MDPSIDMLLWVSCVAALVLSAPSSPPTAKAAPLYTSICGPTGTNDNWSDPLYVATCDVTVPAGATLTIQPGVVVKFPNYSLVVNGRLIAQGSAGHGSSSPRTGTMPTAATRTASPERPRKATGLELVINGPGSVLDHAWIGYGGDWTAPDKPTLS